MASNQPPRRFSSPSARPPLQMGTPIMVAPTAATQIRPVAPPPGSMAMVHQVRQRRTGLFRVGAGAERADWECKVRARDHGGLYAEEAAQNGLPSSPPHELPRRRLPAPQPPAGLARGGGWSPTLCMGFLGDGRERRSLPS